MTPSPSSTIANHGSSTARAARSSTSTGNRGVHASQQGRTTLIAANLSMLSTASSAITANIRSPTSIEDWRMDLSRPFTRRTAENWEALVQTDPLAAEIDGIIKQATEK